MNVTVNYFIKKVVENKMLEFAMFKDFTNENEK